MSDEFNSKKISFIDIPEGENRRAKLYASDLEVLRKLATSGVWVRGFKDKIRLRGFAQGSKATNKLQRRCFEVRKQEATYD